MDSHRVSEEICLQSASPIRLTDAAGTQVRCLQGTIWITVASEPDDVFLRAGQSYLIRRNGLCLVERKGDSSIQRVRWPDPVPEVRACSLRELSRTDPAPSATDFPA